MLHNGENGVVYCFDIKKIDNFAHTRARFFAKTNPPQINPACFTGTKLINCN